MTSQPTTLAGLPPVLISFIAEALAPQDLACLSPCNNQLSTALKPQRNHLRSENEGRTLSTEQKQVRMAILHRLECDLPDYFACHCCFLLHEYDGPKYLGPWQLVARRCDSELPCVDFDRDTEALGVEIGSLSFSNYCNFSFIHVHLAMSIFPYGPRAGISTDSIYYIQVHHTYSISRPPEQITSISIEAAICSNPATLCLRT